MIFLTIDTGTTNTRVCLWRDGEVAAASSTPVGVRSTSISGSTTLLQRALRGSIVSVLTSAGVAESDVDIALASGMITSNLGLHEVPHSVAPSGLTDLGRGMDSMLLADVWSKPIWFIPGIRNDMLDADLKIGFDRCEAMDMMRGEEVEVMGLIDRLGISGPAVFIMPGSHTKFVRIDEHARITGCATTLAGELLQVITNNTILAKTLQNEFAATLDRTALLAGAMLVGKVGLGRACFTTRILDLFGGADRNACANFLLGAMLGADLLTLKNSSALEMRPTLPLIVAGSGVLQQAVATLIAEDDFFVAEVTVVTHAQQTHLAGYGAARVAAARGLLDFPIASPALALANSM